MDLSGGSRLGQYQLHCNFHKLHVWMLGLNWQYLSVLQHEVAMNCIGNVCDLCMYSVYCSGGSFKFKDSNKCTARTTLDREEHSE